MFSKEQTSADKKGYTNIVKNAEDIMGKYGIESFSAVVLMQILNTLFRFDYLLQDIIEALGADPSNGNRSNNKWTKKQSKARNYRHHHEGDL
jgi:hypothetical protein